MKRYKANFIFYSSTEKSLKAWKWLNSNFEERLKFKNIIGFERLLEVPRDSYLINPLPVGTPAEQHMYLKLSSLRNYFDYIESDDVTLPTIIGFKYYSKLQILSNRLLKIRNEKIYFKNEVEKWH